MPPSHNNYVFDHDHHYQYHHCYIMAAKRACTISELKGKLDADCFLYLVRKDKRKFSRATQLLQTNEEIIVVRKMELKVEEEMKG